MRWPASWAPGLLGAILAALLLLPPASSWGAAPAARGPAGWADSTVQPAPASRPPTEAEAARVQAIAAQLRCVVCQALSVADSPSTTAAQMRAVILEQLRAGKSPEEIKAYFVSRYGEWVLLAPARSGFNLLVWWLPFAGLGLGVAAVAVAARRWAARGRATGRRPGGAGRTAADRERLARELEELGR